MDNSFEEYSSEVKEPKNAKQLKLYTLAHDYLIDNFCKFTEANKIKVALVIVAKYIPTKIEGGLNVNQMGNVIKDGKPLEINIGTKPAESS